MKLSLSPLTDRISYAYNNPTKVLIRLGLDVSALACAYVAYEHVNARKAFPCACVCATSELHEFSNTLVTATGLMIASVVVWRYNRYAKPLPAIPGASER